MKSLHWRLLLLANLVAAVAAAAFWFCGFVAPEALSSVAAGDEGVFRISMRAPASQLVALFALALLLGDALWVIYGRQPKAPTNHVVSESPDGPVHVSREALETSIRVAGEGLDEISRLRVSVAPSAGMKRVTVRAQFQSPDGVSLQDANQKLRRTIGLRFQELVRLAEGSRLEIEVEFLGFSGKLAKKAPVVEEPPAADQPPEFTGPQYPIDDDEKREGP